MRKRFGKRCIFLIDFESVTVQYNFKSLEDYLLQYGERGFLQRRGDYRKQTGFIVTAAPLQFKRSSTLSGTDTCRDESGTKTSLSHSSPSLILPLPCLPTASQAEWGLFVPDTWPSFLTPYVRKLLLSLFTCSMQGVVWAHSQRGPCLRDLPREVRYRQRMHLTVMHPSS